MMSRVTTETREHYAERARWALAELAAIRERGFAARHEFARITYLVERARRAKVPGLPAPELLNAIIQELQPGAVKRWEVVKEQRRMARRGLPMNPELTIEERLKSPPDTAWHRLAQEWRPRLVAAELPAIQRVLAELDAVEQETAEPLKMWSRWDPRELTKRGAGQGTIALFAETLAQMQEVPTQARRALGIAQERIQGLTGETMKSDWISPTSEPYAVWAIRNLVRGAEPAPRIVRNGVARLRETILPKLERELNRAQPVVVNVALQPDETRDLPKVAQHGGGAWGPER